MSMLQLKGHASTPDILEVIVASAGSIDIVGDYALLDQTKLPAAAVTDVDRFGVNSAAAETKVALTGPGANLRYNIKRLSICNVHATVANDVTPQRDQAGTNFRLYPKINLLPGEALLYDEGIGWTPVKSPFVEGFQYVRKSAQQSFSATTFADVTGMGFSLQPNATYELEYDIIFRSATTSVGVGVGLNGPASPVSVNGTVVIIGQRSTATTGAVFSAGFTAYDSTTPLSTAVEATATDYICRLAALIENGANAGTIALRWRSETATATTVEAGSFGTCKRIG